MPWAKLRRAVVAQFVRMPVAKSGPLAQPREGTREVLRVHRRPDLAGKDEPVILPPRPGQHLRLGLADAALPEHGHHFSGKRECPS